MYSEGSSLNGFKVKELMSLSSEAKYKAEVDINCTTLETNLFFSQLANGIAGVMPNGNKDNWMQQFLSYDNQINGNSFSICLGNNGGYLNIGNPNIKFWN